MKKHLTRIILITCCWISCLFVWGDSYQFRGVTMADGLSDLLVNVIYKDATGFIWLGTDNSLDRFDGVTVRSYPFPEEARKRVHAITESPDKILWVGNEKGLWMLDRRVGVPERMYEEKIDFPVYSLLCVGQQIYIGTERGLFIKSGEEDLHHVLPDRNLLSSSNKIKGLVTDETGILWLATAKGLYSYDWNEKRIMSYPLIPSVKPEEYRCITRIDDTLYLGTEGMGILCFDISTTLFTSFPTLGNYIITSLSTDGKDRIYVSTDGNGAHFLSHTTQSIVHSFLHEPRNRESIRSNSVYSLLVDETGVVWVGFYQSGLDYTLFQHDLFQVYSFPPRFQTLGLTVRSFYMEGEKKLIGTRDGLFYVDENKKEVLSFHIPQIRSDLILSLCRYRDAYYIGTYGGGLSLLDVNDLSLSDFQYSELTFENGHIFCQQVGPDGHLWMGTSAGVYCYDGETRQIKHYNSSNSQLPEGNVYEIYFDSTGKGWICAEHGLCIYDPEKQSMNVSVFPDGFPHWDKYRVVYEDSANKIYLLPDKGSMIVTDLLFNSYSRVEVPPVVQGNAYMSVQEAQDGCFWFGFDGGMIRTREDLSFSNAFGFKDGIPGQTFFNPSFKDEKEILWFSNAQGLVYVDPSRVDPECETSFPVVLTDILLNGVTLPVEKGENMIRSGVLTLDKELNNLTFCFSDLSYADPSMMVYEYRLEGIDADWKLLNGKNSVSYFALSPGKYQFRVRIPGSDRTEAILPVEISSGHSFYPVAVLLLLLMGGILYWYVRKRKNRLSEDGKDRKSEDKYKTKRIADEECEILRNRLEEYMNTNHPYTNPDLKLADLAKALNMSSHSLSYLFNQYIRLSYYDYVNKFRIEKFKKLANEPAYSQYTLTALAELCGFNSRASFFRSFKKQTGITPSEYLNGFKK